MKRQVMNLFVTAMKRNAMILFKSNADEEFNTD